MADYEWRAVELWDSSDCSSDCGSRSLSSTGEEACDTPTPATRVSFCPTLDAPPSISPPSSLGTRAKGVLKAPRYKVCRAQMRQNLELSGMLSTMSMDLSLRSGDEDDEGGRVDWEEASFWSDGSDDDDTSPATDYGTNESLMLYKDDDGDMVALNQGTTFTHISSNRRSSSVAATAAAAAAATVANFSRSADGIFRGGRHRGKTRAQEREHETPGNAWRSADDVLRGGRGSGPEDEECGSPARRHNKRGLRRPHFRLRKALTRVFPSAVDEMWRVRRHNKDKDKDCKDKGEDKDKRRRGGEGGNEYRPRFT